jgi:hypothetical protein
MRVKIDQREISPSSSSLAQTFANVRVAVLFAEPAFPGKVLAHAVLDELQHRRSRQVANKNSI